MADNITIDTITGSPVARTDDVGGIHYQIVKIAHGADGSVDGIVSAGSPLPITGSITVSANALPTGAATEATLSALNGKVTACNTGAVTVAASALPSGAATEATLAALNAKVTAIDTGAVVISSGAVVVSGTVAVSNFPSNFAVNNFPAGFLAAQSGAWSVSLAAAIPTGSNVIGGVTQSGTWNVAATNAGTFVVQENGAALTALQLIDDAIATTGAAITAKGAAICGTDGTNARVVKTDSSGELQVDVLTQPARTRTADAIAAALQTDALMNGLTALTPKFASISAASSGDNTLVAAVTSKKIRVLSLFIKATAAVDAYIRDNAGSPVNLVGDGTNKIKLSAAGDGWVMPNNPFGWFETTAGQALMINLSAATGVAGSLSYVEV